MATVNFLYRSTKENACLHLRLLYGHTVIGANTKLEVSREFWKKQRHKKSKDIKVNNQIAEVNGELHKIEKHILTAFGNVNTDLVNKVWLQNQIDFYYNPTKQNTIPNGLIQYFDFYIEYRKHELKRTYIQKLQSIKSKISDIEKTRKKQIQVNDVNDSFKNEFVSYYKDNKYRTTTIQREFSFVKTICRHARFKGVATSPELDGLKLPYKTEPKVYLTFKELDKIEKIKKTKLTDSLSNAKDWLIISCFTGQRVSDFMRFNKSMIRYENIEGVEKPFIEFTQVKTSKRMTVPLHPKVMAILKNNGGEFPYRISDQKYNKYIKKVCELANITQMVEGTLRVEVKPKQFRKVDGSYRKCDLVTSHIGRRSFATNFYGEIPTTYLKNVTGHSTEAMFLSYIGKSSKDLAIEMSKYF